MSSERKEQLGWDTSVVDLYADFLGGRLQFDASSIRDLKHQVAKRLNRHDINWSIFTILVNDRECDNSTLLRSGDIIKVMFPITEMSFPRPLSTNEADVITRPFFDIKLSKPKYAFARKDRHYIGVYACGRCGGPLVAEIKQCDYCGFHVNWSSIN